MVEVLVANYYDLLDKRLENSTIVVLLIALCILFVGVFVPHSSSFWSASIIDTNQVVKNIVTIDGEKYEIVLKKL